MADTNQSAPDPNKPAGAEPDPPLAVPAAVSSNGVDHAPGGAAASTSDDPIAVPQQAGPAYPGVALTQTATIPAPVNEPVILVPTAPQPLDRVALSSASLVLQGKLNDAVGLKNYAITSGLSVDPTALRKLNELQLRITAFGQEMVTLADLVDFSTQLDAAISDLSLITAPVTVENVRTLATSGRSPAVIFKWSLLLIGVFVIFLAVAAYSHMFEVQQSLSASVLAASLGILGALVLVLYNAIGVLSEKSVDVCDRYGTTVRLLLGGLSGWVLFFVFAQKAFSSPDPPDPTMLFLPFLAGFSARLVLGVINQALRAVQLTLGIEDANTQLLARQRGRRQLTGATAAASAGTSALGGTSGSLSIGPTANPTG